MLNKWNRRQASYLVQYISSEVTFKVENWESHKLEKILTIDIRSERILLFKGRHKNFNFEKKFRTIYERYWR